jgi:hypothetical protein
MRQKATPEPATTPDTRLRSAELPVSNRYHQRMISTSAVVDPPFTTGHGRPVYSPQAVPTRITLRSVGP